MFEEPLTDSNFMMYAMKHYTNPECGSVEEFQEDMSRIKYLKRLFGKYQNQGILKERLILNHIIIIYNVFPLTPATRLLFHKIEEKYHVPLKTFLVFLGNIPKKKIPEVDLDMIPLDQRIINKLREI